jgi:hypothetical protein
VNVSVFRADAPLGRILMVRGVLVVMSTGDLGISTLTASNSGDDDVIALMTGLTLDVRPVADTRSCDTDVYTAPMFEMPTLMVVEDPESPSPGCRYERATRFTSTYVNAAVPELYALPVAVTTKLTGPPTDEAGARTCTNVLCVLEVTRCMLDAARAAPPTDTVICEASDTLWKFVRKHVTTYPPVLSPEDGVRTMVAGPVGKAMYINWKVTDLSVGVYCTSTVTGPAAAAGVTKVTVVLEVVGSKLTVVDAAATVIEVVPDFTNTNTCDVVILLSPKKFMMTLTTVPPSAYI